MALHSKKVKFTLNFVFQYPPMSFCSSPIILTVLVSTIFFSSNAQSVQKGSLWLRDSTTLQVTISKKPQEASAKGVYLFDYLQTIQAKENVKTYRPEDIQGFTFGKKTFKTLSVQLDDRRLHLFAQQLDTGFAELYYYDGTAFGQQEVYIFRKRLQPFYYISLASRVKSQSDDASGHSMQPDLQLAKQMNQLIHNLSDDKAFQDNFLKYFSDCKPIVIKLKQAWYTPSSISTLFKDYNKECATFR